jgi:hypothetical protein
MFYNPATRRDSNGELVLDVLQRARVSTSTTITAKEQKRFYDMFANLTEPTDYLDVAFINGINDKAAYTRMCFFLNNSPLGRQLVAGGMIGCDRQEGVSKAITIVKQFDAYRDDAGELVIPDAFRVNGGPTLYSRCLTRTRGSSRSSQAKPSGAYR